MQGSLDKLKMLSNALMEKEVLDGEEVKLLLGIEKKTLFKSRGGSIHTGI